MKYFILILGLAAAGCTTSGSVTEGDRQVAEQTEKGVAAARQELDQAAGKLEDGSDVKVGVLKAGDALRVCADNLAQQRKAHGGPKTPTGPFSEQESARARQQSEKEHAGIPWGSIALGVGSAAVGIAGAFLGMPWLSSVFPVLTGKVGKLATAMIQATTRQRQTAEAAGGKLHLADLLEIHKDEQVRAGVQDLASDLAKKAEEKFGVEHEFDLAAAVGLKSPEALPTDTVTVTPPAAPAPSTASAPGAQ